MGRECCIPKETKDILGKKKAVRKKRGSRSPTVYKNSARESTYEGKERIPVATRLRLWGLLRAGDVWNTGRWRRDFFLKEEGDNTEKGDSKGGSTR